MAPSRLLVAILPLAILSTLCYADEYPNYKGPPGPTAEELNSTEVRASVRQTGCNGPYAFVAPVINATTAMVVEYDWQADDRDLDTNTEFLGETIGYSCSRTRTYLTWNGDNTSYGGVEVVTVMIGEAENDGEWSTGTEVKLHSHWYGQGDGQIRISVYLKNSETNMVMPGTNMCLRVTPNINYYQCSNNHLATVHIFKSGYYGYSFHLIPV